MIYAQLVVAAKPDANSSLSVRMSFLEADAVGVDANESVAVDAERVE